MKANKIFIILISLFLMILAGCSSGSKIEGNKIIVEKQAAAQSKYELYGEVKDNKEVENAKQILKDVKWEIAKVDMAHPADYKFYFQDSNSKITGAIYELWVSPNKDKIELVIENESKYVQLDKEKSEQLFKLITRKSLSEF